jgi:DNA polymerase-1
LITDEPGLVKVRDFLLQNKTFGLDVETPPHISPYWNRKLRLIQVGNREQQFLIDLLPFAERAGLNLVDIQGNFVCHPALKPIYDTLKPFLESREYLKLGHNLNFEYETLKWCMGFRIWNLYDTMWAEKVIHAGEWHFKAAHIWGLEDTVGRYTGLLISKDQQLTFNLASELTNEQKQYAALDIRVLFPVKAGQALLLNKYNLWRAVQIENDAIPAFGDMHLNGIMLSIDPWMEIISAVKTWHKYNVDRLDQFFVPIVGTKSIPEYHLDELEMAWRNEPEKEARKELRIKYMAAKKRVTSISKDIKKFEGEAAINYDSPAQVLKALRKIGYDAKKLPDSEDPSLKRVAKFPNLTLKKALAEDSTLQKYDIIDCVRLYRESGKVLKNYGDNFIAQHVHFFDGDKKFGYIHSNIIQLGAETGRTSSEKPNIQNIPKDDSLPVPIGWRSCFTAPRGYKTITVDYSGQELCILAEYSQEKAWIDAFRKGWDVHSVGAEIIYAEEWLKAAESNCAYYAQHKKCKCKLHKELRDKVKAINFGIAYGKEAKSLSEELQITEKEATLLLSRYKKAFPTLTAYLEASGKKAAMLLESRTLAMRRRMFRKPEWKLAVERAQERNKGNTPNMRQINSAYKGMYSSITREGKNTPIQGSGADMVKIAMGCGFDQNDQPFLWHKLEPEYDGKLVNMVHDELVAYSPEEKADPCFNMIGDCMVRAGAELVKTIPMTYEGHVDNYWRK